MTLEEIKQQFGLDRQVYQFNGTLQDLTVLQEEQQFSMNYMIIADVIYFVSDRSVVDTRLELI
jgi:hypothetical protein